MDCGIQYYNNVIIKTKDVKEIKKKDENKFYDNFGIISLYNYNDNDKEKEKKS